LKKAKEIDSKFVRSKMSKQFPDMFKHRKDAREFNKYPDERYATSQFMHNSNAIWQEMPMTPSQQITSLIEPASTVFSRYKKQSLKNGQIPSFKALYGPSALEVRKSTSIDENPKLIPGKNEGRPRGASTKHSRLRVETMPMAASANPSPSQRRLHFQK